MRPVIGITGDSLVEPAAAINLNQADMAPNMIKNAVIKTGGLPIIVPFPDDVNMASDLAQAVVKTFDGLLLPGGPDVDPTMYHEEPLTAMGRSTYPKDVFEIALIKATIKAGKPIFAICRGLQVLNVALGGTLYQDIATQNATSQIKHAQSAPGQYPTHHIRIVEDSTLGRLLGTTAYVNSRHHQALKQVGTGLKVTATAPDGIIEAVENTMSTSILAVQWHPENMWMDYPEQLLIFEQFIKRVRAVKS